MTPKLPKEYKKNKRCIVVADDFGVTDGVSEGIIKTYREGLVTELSLQIGSKGTARALELLKKHKIKDVGIHLLLYNWEETGKIFHREDYIKLFKEKSADEVKKIAINELENFEKLVGKKPTHIIPQYGIHGNLRLLEGLVEYANKYSIPMRIPRTALVGKINEENYAAEIILKRNNIKTTDHLFSHILGSDLSVIKKAFLDDLSGVKEGETVEILMHPGFVDLDLLQTSSLRYERGRDIALCINQEFRRDIEKLGFNLTAYSKI